MTKAQELLNLCEASLWSKDEISKATELGKQAFTKGMKSVPAHDTELMKMVKDKAGPIGTSAELFKAWSKGWNSENLK